MIAIDTSLMVDYLRGTPDALAWLKAQGDEELALPGPVVLELLQGCRDKPEMRRLHSELVRRFRVIWPTTQDLERALEHYVQTMPEGGFEVMDLLIGETAAGLGIPLCTLNTRHLSNVPGVEVLKPY